MKTRNFSMCPDILDILLRAKSMWSHPARVCVGIAVLSTIGAVIISHKLLANDRTSLKKQKRSFKVIAYGRVRNRLPFLTLDLKIGDCCKCP
jgi:hypothetical protein